MKWLNNIFKGGRTHGERSSLSLKEVDSWLQQHEDPSGFAERLDRIYSRMEKAAVSLSRDISDLNSAQPDPGTPPKLLRAGLAARGELSKQLDSLCEKLQPPHKRIRIMRFSIIGPPSRAWRGPSPPLAGPRDMWLLSFPRILSASTPIWLR